MLLNTVTYIPSSTITYFAPDMNEITYQAAKNISMYKTSSTPLFDGLDNDVIWQNAPLFKGQTIGKGDGAAAQFVTNNSDAQLSWKATWNATALYVVLKVKDDVQVWSDALKGWNVDVIEFYVTKDAIATAETGTLGRSTQTKVLWQNLYTASPAGRVIMEFRGTDNTSLAGTKTPVAGTLLHGCTTMHQKPLPLRFVMSRQKY